MIIYIYAYSYNDETFGYIDLNKSLNAASSPQPYAGVPSCANKGLLTDLARKQWGFNGYITTDCGAADYVGGFLDRNGYPATAADTVYAVLGAGVDTDCGGAGTPRWSNATLLSLLTNASTTKRITPVVDAALRRLFTVRMRLGHFDPPSATPWGTWGLEQVDTPDHRALALDAALQGFVLLQNNRGTTGSNGSTRGLPLDVHAKIAVLGPNILGNAGWQLGNYHERQVPHGVLVSPCVGMQQVAAASGVVTCVQPKDCTIGGNASCFSAESATAIASADAVVLFVGLDGSQEAEGHDKTSLLLPGTQQAMVDAATDAVHRADPHKKKTVVVVVMGGSAVDLSTLKANPTIDAIVWVGYPGQAGGVAIATALYGRENRWGKSPFTWYDEGFCRLANLSDYRMRPDVASGYPGRTHRFYTGTPVFAFGTGLSFTTFSRTLAWQTGTQQRGVGKQLQPVQLVVHRWTSGGMGDPERVVATLSIDVTNNGNRTGDEVVLVYVVPPHGVIESGAPRQQLVAFTRVTLAAGESTRVSLGIKQRHLQLALVGSSSNRSGGVWRARVNEDEVTALRFTLKMEM